MENNKMTIEINIWYQSMTLNTHCRSSVKAFTYLITHFRVVFLKVIIWGHNFLGGNKPFKQNTYLLA